MADQPQPIGIDITAQIFARMALTSPSADNQAYIDAASGTDQDKLLQIALWIPSALQESMAQYRAGQGRGLVLCDQFGPARMWYVPQKDSHTALTRVPQDIYDDLDLCLNEYDPAAEAVLVLQSLHTAQVIFVEADGQIRSRGSRQRTPFQPQAPLNRPPGVTSTRKLRPEGGVTYEYTHTALGPLGRISVLPFGVQSKLQTEFAGGEPSDPTLAQRLELFQQIAQELDQKFHAMRGEDVPDPQAFNLDRMQESVSLYSQFITADSSFELEQLVRKLSADDLDKLIILAKQAIETASPHDAIAIRQRLDDLEEIRTSPPSYSPLVGWLNDFIQAPTVDRAKAILRAYPELLSQEAEAELEQFWAHDATTQRQLDQRKKLWQRAYRRATSSQSASKKSSARRPEITPTMRVLMQSTLCLARGSGPIPRFLLRELDHPEITQDIDQALDDLIALRLLKRDGKYDVYITREGYAFRDDHPADVVIWVSVSYAMCTLVQRLLEAQDVAALDEVEIHLRALTNMMLRRPGGSFS